MGAHGSPAGLLINLPGDNNMPSIKDRLSNSRSQKDLTEIRAMFVAVQTDLAALQAKHNALLAKLDADAGVTDTNYTALHAVGTLRTQP